MRGWCQISHIFSPQCSRSIISCSAAATKDTQQFYRKCDEFFLPWLRRKTGHEISTVLSVGFSAHGRSLFASQPIQAGDCILKIPYSAHITSDKIPPELECLLVDDAGNISRIAAVLQVEKKLGQNSEWGPYINCLPSTSEMNNTIFWSKEELDMVQQSPIYQETINQKAFIEMEFLTLKSALEHLPQRFGDFKLEDFMLAYASIISRAWRTSKGVSLIPFADFLNHDGGSEAILLSDDVKETSEVIADRDYTVGDQAFLQGFPLGSAPHIHLQNVLIRYGKFSNATLLLDFGFTLPYNIYDQVQIWMDLPTHDPLYTMKLELFHKFFLPKNMQAGSLKTSGSPFIIREVKSVSGKGKGIPQALRAFARLLSITSREELIDLGTEAALTDGRLARRPLKSTQSEIRAHCILVSRLNHMIQGHEVSVKVLESTDSDTNSRLALRRQLAKDLLFGELRVLKSASAWLTEYCSSLSAFSGR